MIEREADYTFREQHYNCRLEPSDWRFSAAAVGLMRYFEFFDIPHEKHGRNLYYNFEDIDLEDEIVESQYLKFVESRFINIMHHCKVRDFLSRDELTEDLIKEIKKSLSANVVMKKVFKGIDVNSDSKDLILKLIEENKNELIRETYKNGISGYRKFINQALYGKEEQQRCRLWGFYTDQGRKTKSLGYGFSKEAATVTDCKEFDYIPFAFSRDRESIFINNNFSLQKMLKANNDMDDRIKRREDNNVSWNTIFYDFADSGQFIEQDVEIILKNIEEELYETVMIRQAGLNVFKELVEGNKNGYKVTSLDKLLKRKIKINDDYYLDMCTCVTDSILNEKLLNDLIEKIFKLDSKKSEGPTETFVISQLIRVNVVLFKHFGIKEDLMEVNKHLIFAYYGAKAVVDYFNKNNVNNKLKGYRQKLTSSIVAKDYDRFIEVMLQLSSYTEISFKFLHYLIEDFEGNKNIAYEFINCLSETNEN